MKKLTTALALVLCLVLCIFAFASCGKKNKTTSTTAAETDPATAQSTTAPEATTVPATTTKKAHVHTIPDEWEPEYLVKPTCRTEGIRVKYCPECGEKVAEETVPADPTAHVVDEWTIVEPTMFEPVGSKSGVCTVCEEPLNFVLNWELTTYSSVESTGKYIEGVEFATNKTVEEIRGDKSFAPTEDDPDGNDLWFEYSLLYNKTLYNHDYPNSLSEIRLFCFRESTNRSVYRGFYYLYLRDNMDPFKTSGDCPFRGHIDYSTYLLDWPGWSDETAYQCADDLTALGNTLNGKPIGQYMAGWAYCHPGGITKECSPYLWDSEWQTLNGWHRLGFRYHQDAEIKEGAVVYSGYTELYIDGVLCWRIHSNYKPGHKDSLVTKNLLLWTAEIDNTDPENPKLVYTNHDSMMVGMRMDNFKQASQEVLMAIDDVRWTCGDGFAVPVKRVENPKPVPTTLKEGVDDVIAVYYAKPDCVHEAEDEWVVVKEATVAEPGLKAKYCAKCGERMETEELEYVPYVYNPADLDSYTFNNDKGMLLITKTLPEIAGEDHFYPTDETPAGKALYYEFAILYNETMANSATQEYDLCLNYQGVGGKTLFCFVTKDNANSWCKYAGGFDYSNKKAILYGPDGGDSQPKENYPNLGNYGWHMIGVKFYQTAALDGDNVVYSGVSTLYIDGNKVWEIDFDMSKLLLSGDKTLRLFDATNNAGVLEYADNPNAAKVRMQLRGEGINGSTAPFYFIFGDVSWNIVAADFTSNVKPVADPAAATYKINDDLTVPAAVYFEAK